MAGPGFAPAATPVMRATIDGLWWETPTVRGIRLRVGADFVFLPGQWLDLWAREGGPAGGYSMTSSPLLAETVDLALRASAHHPVTRFLHQEAQEGDEVRISPQGQGEVFFVPTMHRRVVLIGAGIGITPLMSIIRHVVASRAPTEMTLLYGAHEPAEIPFRRELDAMAQQGRLNLVCTVSEGAGRGLRRGRVDPPLIGDVVERTSREALFYLCGPAEMIRMSRESLLQAGVAAPAIRYESWAG